MALKLPNIYTSRRLKFLMLVPLLLMVISLYLSTNLTLDFSLSGGASIVLQSNTTMSPSQIASQLAARIPAESSSVQSSPTGLQITIASNKSLSQAYDELIKFYSFNSTYNAYFLNETGIRGALATDPGNTVLQGLLVNASNGVNQSITGMTASLAAETAALKPFGITEGNTSTPNRMSSSAYNEYTNATAKYKNDTINALRTIVPFTSYSYQEVTVQQSSYFLGQLEYIIIIAFILISVVVFIIFRTLVPSLAVIFGAGNDIIVALGAMALFKIPLGIASIGGLLMLLGYSIDTDVLTAIRIIKRHEGTPEERAYSSMKTGLTMTMTAIVSFAVLFIVSLVAYVPTYYEISGVVLFGLIGDVFTTWFGNASMILLYMKRKERK
ncbi:MAG: hypothetical protein KGH72_00165 [Candidatus Micrarchaeota archaeon]|nr:hypothetical protein [Candidatus Micrarchaeota archaeon]